MAQFSDIPAELRNLIYDALLSHSQNPYDQFSSGNALSLFRVSKQLHNEASSYFYQHNEIRINTPCPMTESATILPPIADKYLRFLRRLRVHATIGCADATVHSRIASTIWSVASTDAKFDDVHITIQSSISRLVNSRVDDSILGPDDPITIALRTLLDCRVAKSVRLHLYGTWFTPFVFQALKSQYGDCLMFVDENDLPQDRCFITRHPTGMYAATHMHRLGFTKQVMTNGPSPDYTSAPSVPSSISSSIGSALADLDMFSVADFERESDNTQKNESKDEATADDSFFSGADIEEWEDLEQQQQQLDSSYSVDTDMSDSLNSAMGEEDEELEDLDQDDFDAIMGNMEDVAHHVANQADITYLTNFAPELLLSRHQLDHLA